ncbi:MAG: translocation/assembly module TamB domain-containing protein [Sneathiella sp.]|nr:translocation/assembly module TamB domain-containing protein [Sneathiella sp.]
MTRRKLIAILIAAPLLLVLGALAGGYAFVQTDTGRGMAVRQIEAAASEPGVFELELGPLQGNLFSGFSLAGVHLRDAAGEWLSAENIAVSWSPFDLLSGRLTINEITAQSLSVDRQPVFPKGEEKENTGSILPLPVDIALSRLEIREIRIAEPVVGQAATLALAMNLNAEINDVIHSELEVTDIGGNGGEIRGSIDFDPGPQTLAVDFKLHEPEGGLIARALDLPGFPELNAAVVGNGALNGWRGQLRAGAGKLFDADFAVSTRGAEKIDIDLKGGVLVDADFAKSIPFVDGSRISVTAAVIYDTKSGGITVSSSDIENNVLAAKADGRINPSTEALKLSLATTLRDATSLNDLIAPASVGKAAIDLDIDGTFDAITVNAILRAGGLDIEDSFAASEVTGTFTSKLDLEKLETIPVKGSAALTGVSKLSAETEALVGQSLDIDFEAAYTLETEFLSLSASRIAGKHISADATGDLTVKDLSANADISMRLNDLSALAPMGGELAAELKLTSPDISSTMTGLLRARAEKLDMRDAGLQAVTGSAPAMTAALDLAGGSFTLNDIDLKLAAGAVTGKAEFPLSFETVKGALKANLPGLAAFDQLAGVKLAGAAVVTADISGALTDPEAKGTLAARNLDVDGTPLGKLDASYTAKTLASGAAGTFKGRLTHPKLTADASGKFALPDYARLELADLEAMEKKNTVVGGLTIPFDGKPLTGKLTAKIPDLAAIAALADASAGGSVQAVAIFADQKGAQSVTLALTGQGLDAGDPGTGVKTLEVTAATLGAFDKPAIDMKAEASGISAGGTAFKTAALTAKGSMTDLAYRFDLARGAEPELDLAGSGALSLNDAKTELQLTSLDGAFAGKKIALTTPLIVRLKGQDIDVQTFALTFGEGKLQGSGSLKGTAAASVSLDFDSLPLDMLALVDPALDLTGSLGGSAALTIKEGAQSSGTIAVNATDVRFIGEEYAGLPAFASKLDATLKDGQLAFSGDVTGVEATTIEASGGLPLTVSLTPPYFPVNENKPVNLKIKIDSDIKKIWPFLALDTQVMSGQLQADAMASGTVSAPVLVGTATLTDGEYENIEQGTILKQITLKADIEDSQTLKFEVTAADEEGGTIKSTGRVDFAKLTDPRVDMKILLENLLAVNRDDVSVTADGDIEIKGGLKALGVTGGITTDEVNINIGGAVAPNVVTLNVEEINRPGAKAKAEADGETVKPSKIALNLTLDLPKRVFIRGRGLDSEWEGKFTIKGTAKAPIIEGYLSPVRGQFSFAGKSFKLQKGEIALLGDRTLDPELNLSAQYVGSSVTATVTISGTTSNPKISFSSPDGLPEDEVLSQVLFGKSSGKLSALEAVQLAETLATLSGKLGSGGGIMGFARETLGVDVISAGTDANTGKAEVSVGKYVTENVYVGVDQGTETGSTRAKVQIELTPHISVESELGQSTDSSVGIFWKWDY